MNGLKVQCIDPACKKLFVKIRSPLCPECRTAHRRYYQRMRKRDLNQKNKYNLDFIVPQFFHPKPTFEPIYRNHDIEFNAGLHFRRTY